jgi:hypothetical protein
VTTDRGGGVLPLVIIIITITNRGGGVLPLEGEVAEAAVVERYHVLVRTLLRHRPQHADRRQRQLTK